MSFFSAEALLEALPAAKRRRKVLRENKLEVLKLIDSGTSYSSITRQYGIGKNSQH